MAGERFAQTKDGIGSYTLANGERRYRVLYRVNGRLRSKGGFRLKEEARRWRDKTRTAVDEGSHVDPNKGKKTLDAHARDWLATLNVRPNTAALYEYVLRVHVLPALGDTQLRQITPAAVRHWYADLQRKPSVGGSTAGKAYGLLKRVLGVAVDEGLIPTNPCRVKGGSKQDAPEMHCPSAEQVMNLADAVAARRPQYRAMILLAGFGGLRWGEVTALRRQHVDLAAGCVHVREQATEVDGRELVVTPLLKTAAGRRTVYLPAVVTEALALHLMAHVDADADALLFSTRRGSAGPTLHLRRSRFRRDVWLPATAEAGCPGVRFHDLRHAAATLAAITGATTAELMAHMGHASPAAALRYQHATRARQQAIAAGLDALLDDSDSSGRAAMI